MNFFHLRTILLLYLILTWNFAIFSQNNTEEQESKPQKNEGIHVIGNKKEDLKKIPGSAYIIDKKYLEEASPTDPMEALRRSPGASVRFQDAAGLTPNIGFRGVSNEESRKTLILEDGILTSLSPYGQPESYYSPSIERMERIEIIKGSGSILFGPNTIGGIVNFVTKRPPMWVEKTDTYPLTILMEKVLDPVLSKYLYSENKEMDFVITKILM